MHQLGWLEALWCLRRNIQLSDKMLAFTNEPVAN